MKLTEKIGGSHADVRRIVLELLLSFFALLALRYNFEFHAGLETDSAVINLLSSVPNSFGFSAETDVLIFIAVFMLYRAYARRGAHFDPACALLAFVFSLLHTLGFASVGEHGWHILYADAYQLCCFVLCLAGFAALYYPALRLLCHAFERPRTQKKLPEKPVLLGAVIIFLAWLPWLLLTYPGTFCLDSASQLAVWTGMIPPNAHHPPLSTLLMGLCYSLGAALGSVNFGCFLYLLLQAVLGAWVFSFCLSRLFTVGAPRGIWIAGLVFFCASPIWYCHVQWFEKDMLYAIFFALFVSLLLPAVDERRCSLRAAVGIGLSALTAILLRKTGLYELGAALIAVTLWLRRADRRRMAAVTAAVLLLSLGVENVLYPRLGIEAGSVREALSIPFRQTAKYCLSYPDEVSDAEREVIDAVLDYEQFPAYSKTCSDSIKNTYRGDSSALPAYFKLWLSMFFKHPLSYFETAFETSSAVLDPETPCVDAVIQLNTRGHEFIEQMGIRYTRGETVSAVLNSIREICICFPLFSIFAMAGSYTWCLMLCFTELLRRRRYHALILLIPGIMNVLVCIASPINGSTRYELPLIAVLPLIIGYTAAECSRGDIQL